MISAEHQVTLIRQPITQRTMPGFTHAKSAALVLAVLLLCLGEPPISASALHDSPGCKLAQLA